MKRIFYAGMILIFVGCTKSDEIVLPDPVVLDTIAVCINSREDLNSLNNGLDTFKVTRVILEDDTEVATDGPDLSAEYIVKATSGGNSLFDSTLIIKVAEGDIVKTYTATVWSKGCKYTQQSSDLYTNLNSEGVIYKVNTYFNWVVQPYGAGGPRIKYLVVN